MEECSKLYVLIKMCDIAFIHFLYTQLQFMRGVGPNGSFGLVVARHYEILGSNPERSVVQ